MAASEEAAERWISWTDASDGYIEVRDRDGRRDQGVGSELVSVALTFHNTAPDAVDTPICNDPDAISTVARNRVPKMRQGGSYSASSGLSTRFRTSLKVSKKNSGFGGAISFSEVMKNPRFSYNVTFIFYLWLLIVCLVTIELL